MNRSGNTAPILKFLSFPLSQFIIATQLFLKLYWFNILI